MTTPSTLVQLKKKDFESDQEVRWCPGCGDYSVLAAVQKVMPELGIAKENIAVISGIGCSSRFPYYMNTYGFHTIHGRAPAVATGLKTANPDLSVWVITGDGDALSIGGNHMMHVLRRNVDLNILMFNNNIYGLTKGQYSPTSEVGKITKSTPLGSLDEPVNPIAFALASGASFIARALDVDAKGLGAVLKAATQHKGTSFVEIFQNCNVFNDGAHAHVSERKFRKARHLVLEDQTPMIFGDDAEQGIAFDGFTAKIVSAQEADKFEASNKVMAHALAQLQAPEFPVPMGILYQKERPTYDALANQQMQAAKTAGPSNMNELIHSGDTWQVS